MSQHKKDTGQPFLAGIKKLVNQILFVLDVPRQQMCDEQIGKGVFPVTDCAALGTIAANCTKTAAIAWTNIKRLVRFLSQPTAPVLPATT
ncbi:MAG: hypothetical protein WAL58_05805 [Terriglobales bacterium]|jgi:hypothetical protein